MSYELIENLQDKAVTVSQACRNHSEAMTDVADYIVGFYNCMRLHSKLGNLSHNAFERKSAIQPPGDVSEIT